MECVHETVFAVPSEIVGAPPKDTGLDKMNVVEEVGDGLWYVALLVDALGTTYDQLVKLDRLAHLPNVPMQILFQFGVQQMHISSCRLLDMLKSQIYYNRDLDVAAFTQHLSDALVGMSLIVGGIGTTIEVCVAVNKAKLEYRYKLAEGYSNEQANERNLEEEKAVIGEAFKVAQKEVVEMMNKTGRKAHDTDIKLSK